MDYLEKTDFLTPYAIEKFGPQKAKNFIKLQGPMDPVKTIKSKEKKYGRAIETMYRSVYRNQINLSSMADNKANMLIGINAVMLSVMITLVSGGSLFAGEFSADYKFFIPLAILVLSAGAAMINATLAARPNVPKMTSFNKNMSLFFFENLIQLKKPAYLKIMNDLKYDEEDIYDQMSADIYDHSRVLSKKYRKLKTAYNIFMIGLIAALASFLILNAGFF